MNRIKKSVSLDSMNENTSQEPLWRDLLEDEALQVGDRVWTGKAWLTIAHTQWSRRGCDAWQRRVLPSAPKAETLPSPEQGSPCVICAEPITPYDSYGVGKVPGARYHWHCIRAEAETVSPPKASPCRACAAMRVALKEWKEQFEWRLSPDYKGMLHITDVPIQFCLSKTLSALKLPCDCQSDAVRQLESELIRVKGLVVERDAWLPQEERAQLESDLAQARASEEMLRQRADAAVASEQAQRRECNRLRGELKLSRASAEDHCRRADTAESAVGQNCRRIAELEAELKRRDSWGHEHNLAEAWREVFNLCYDLGMGDSDLSALEQVEQFIRARPQRGWISLSERRPTAEDGDEFAKFVEARNPDEEEFEKAFGNIFQPFLGVTTISDEECDKRCRVYAKAIWDAARKEKPC